MINNYLLNKAEYGTHTIISRELGTGKLTLDIGCNEGYLKDLSPNNTFVGLDLFEDNVKKAKELGYKDAFQLDLNNYASFSYPQKFDALVFADVLEHLIFPTEVLNYFVNTCLKDNGLVVISLPNVAHFSTRLNLLLGKFDYTDSGILDRTHLHLYTTKSARALADSANLSLQAIKYSSNRFGKLIEKFPVLASLLGFNIILICRKKS